MNEVNEISLEGFKVVSGDFFVVSTRIQAPTLTIWENSIGFSKQDLTMLNSCENILIKINGADRKILVIPTTSKDKDGVRWVKKLTPLEARKINCPKLTEHLFKTWAWDTDYIYRSTGHLVTSGNKVMLLFDFASPERWKKRGLKKA